MRNHTLGKKIIGLKNFMIKKRMAKEKGLDNGYLSCTNTKLLVLGLLKHYDRVSAWLLAFVGLRLITKFCYVTKVRKK